MLLLGQLKKSKVNQDKQEELLEQILKNINRGIIGINEKKEIFLRNEKLFTCPQQARPPAT